MVARQAFGRWGFDGGARTGVRSSAGLSRTVRSNDTSSSDSASATNDTPICTTVCSNWPAASYAFAVCEPHSETISKRATDFIYRWFGVFAVTGATVDRCVDVRWSYDELGNPVRGVARPRRDGGCTTGPRVQLRATAVLRLLGTGLSSMPGRGCVRSR